MFKWLKKHFIPHKGNDHQPHFLRDKNTRNLVFAIFAIEFIVLLLPLIPPLYLMGNRFTASVLPAVLDDLTNQNRQAQHLAVLTVNPLLNEVAQLKAEDMASKGYFAHTSPDGNAPWYWFKKVGYNYEYAGENLAVDFTDSQDVSAAWMNSPEHKANILKNDYTEVGTGIATGTYEGKPTVFVAQEFGKPASKTITNVSVRVATNVVPVSSLKGTSTPRVLGAEANSIATETVPVSSQVQKSYQQTYKKINIFEKYAASPRHIANIILAIFGVLIIIALLFKLFIRMDKQHPRLITNGLVVLALIFGVYVVNNYVANARMEAVTSFAGFQGDQFDQVR